MYQNGYYQKKRDVLARCGENWSLMHCWYSHYGKQYGGFSKIKNRTTIWSSNSTSGYVHKGNETGFLKNICTPLFISVLLTIAKTWKQLSCSLTEEWIKKMVYNIYIYTHFYICVHIYVKQQNVIYPWERMKSCHAKKIDGPWVRYTKQKKSEKDKYFFCC